MLTERKSGAVELRVGGLRTGDGQGGDPVVGSGERLPRVDVRLRLRTWLDATPQSRSTGDDGAGEFVALRRAWASRKAATAMRCDESLAKLSPRGRGLGRGSRHSDWGGGSELEREEVMWRKDFKLNESNELAGSCARAEEDWDWRDGGGTAALDFVRPLGRAHENRPPFLDCFGGCRGE